MPQTSSPRQPLFAKSFCHSILGACSRLGISVSELYTEELKQVLASSDDLMPFNDFIELVDKAIALSDFATVLPLLRFAQYGDYSDVLTLLTTGQSIQQNMQTALALVEDWQIRSSIRFESTNKADYLICQPDELLSPSGQRYFLEYLFATYHSLSLGIKAQLGIQAIDWAFDEPAWAEEYQSFFTVPMRFGQATSRLHLKPGCLAQTLDTHSPELAEMALTALHNKIAKPQTQCKEGTELAKLSPELAQQLTAFWQGSSAAQTLKTQDLADYLQLSVRSLQRSLSQQGTSFVVLRSEYVMQEANRLLEQKHLSIDEIAETLGFADRTSFSHAYKRYFDFSPAQRRKR